MTHHRRLSGVAIAALLGLSPALAQRVHTETPTTVALMAAVGDQLSFVRQRQGTGSHIEPFTRQTLQLEGKQLNYAVLRGLDRAIELEEPAARRVLLSWNPPAELTKALNQVSSKDRNEQLLDALRKHLESVPDRKQWDRIEAVLPHYNYHGVKGLGTKLNGIGVYVQPLARNSIDIDTEGGVVEREERAGDYHTVNPRTGEKSNYSTYVAPYFYFDRVTLDAKTLKVLSRKPQMDSVKYHDPDSVARDVSGQLTTAEVFGKLLDLAEKSAYKSVRGTVEVGAPRAITPPPTKTQ